MKLPARYKCDWCGTVVESKPTAFDDNLPGWVGNDTVQAHYCGECVSYLINILPHAIQDRLGPDEATTDLRSLMPLLRVLRSSDFEAVKAVAAVESDGEAQETPQEDA